MARPNVKGFTRFKPCPKCGVDIAWASKLCRKCFWIGRRRKNFPYK